MVKTPYQYRGLGSIPDQGTQLPHAGVRVGGMAKTNKQTKNLCSLQSYFVAFSYMIL